MDSSHIETQQQQDHHNMNGNGNDENSSSSSPVPPPVQEDNNATNGDVNNYDDLFPSLPSGAAVAAPSANPIGEWNRKPKLVSSTVTQVKLISRLADDLSVWKFSDRIQVRIQ